VGGAQGRGEEFLYQYIVRAFDGPFMNGMDGLQRQCNDSELLI